MDKSKVSRVIKHCSGGLIIETEDTSGTFITHYINRLGVEENSFNKRATVLPMDRIDYYIGDFTSNSIQDKALTYLLDTYKGKVKKVIKRSGDFNFLIELKDKVISINSIGWILPFNNISVDYMESEIIQNFEDEKLAVINTDLIGTKETAKEGDIVEAWYGKEIIQGRISRVYNEESTLNIIYDNETKHTAIFRGSIIKVLKCA